MDKWIIKYIWFVYFYVVKRTYKNYYENIPDSWSLTTLSKISSLITKGTTPKGGNVSYLNKGIR
ncbi:hypothetical protein, partial [Mycoplasmopsis arginini]